MEVRLRSEIPDFVKLIPKIEEVQNRINKSPKVLSDIKFFLEKDVPQNETQKEKIEEEDSFLCGKLGKAIKKRIQEEYSKGKSIPQPSKSPPTTTKKESQISENDYIQEVFISR
jgi:hypothetical protein